VISEIVLAVSCFALGLSLFALVDALLSNHRAARKERALQEQFLQWDRAYLEWALSELEMIKEDAPREEQAELDDLIAECRDELHKRERNENV